MHQWMGVSMAFYKGLVPVRSQATIETNPKSSSMETLASQFNEIKKNRSNNSMEETCINVGSSWLSPAELESPIY